MKQKILQMFADYIIKNLEVTLNKGNYTKFDELYKFAMFYNDFCIAYFDIYLD
jgi:hypothetical protein